MVAVLAVLIGIGSVAALAWGGYTVPEDILPPTVVLNLAVGWSFIGVGLIVWRRTAARRGGTLMIVVGFAWFLRLVVAIDNDFAFRLGVVLGSLYLSVLVHLIVSYPTGRLSNWSPRVVVAVAYLMGVPLDAFFLFLAGATRQRGGGDEPPPNEVVVIPFEGDFQLDVVSLIVQTAVVVLCAAIIWVTLARWRRSPAPLRRKTAPAVLGGVLIVAAIMLQRTAFIFFLTPDLAAAVSWIAQIVLVLWPTALLFGLLRRRLDRSAVGRLLVELGSGLPVPDRLRASLAAALRDPSVEISYWVEDPGEFVDSRGHPVDIETAEDRAVTYLERDGSRIAALTHDPSLDPELVRAAAAGAALAIDNERLNAQLTAQLREVGRSRARIVEASDAARRKVERDLHDGSQQRLLSVALALRLTRSQAVSGGPLVGELLRETREELSAALGELGDLARGIYPAQLADGGLQPAVSALAQRSPVPATVESSWRGRLPDSVEQAAYFLVSEALTNAGKHSGATLVMVRIAPAGQNVRVEVIDDGHGGATMTGSGLRGLADRVAAIGGRFRLDSPVGHGTRVTAELPCG